MFDRITRTVLVLGTAACLAAGCSGKAPEETTNPAANAPAADTAVTDDVVVAQGHTGVLGGVVTDVSGQPVAGAFVRLDSVDGRLTFMFISQEGGRYTANKLPAGSFAVQAVGGDFQSPSAAIVEVSEQGAVQMDLALTVERAPDLPAAWPRRVPEHMADASTLPDGRGKDIIMTRCTGCHTEASVVTRRVDRTTWESTVAEMREMMLGVDQPDLSDEEVTVLIDYLTANLLPMPAPDPNSRLPRTLLQGEARNYRVVQYNLENELAEAHDVAVDPWGVGWANQRTGGKISRFDPVTYEYREIGPPLYTAKRARPGNLQISKDGIMWLPDPFETRWLSYDIAADEWTDWPFPSDKIRGQVQGNSMALHQDGSIWSAGPGAARRLNPATGEWSAWDTPTWTRTQQNPGGYGITIAGDGRAWMAQNVADLMARFDGTTGEVVEFEIPVEGIAFPRRMDHDREGDVWVGLWGASKILKIDQHTAEMTVIDPPIPYNGAYSIDFDESTDLLWVTLQTVDYFARYNTKSEDWLLLPLPQAETDARRIEVDQNQPNRVWWSSTSNFARIGFVELLDSGS
jgi:streptogramin lyase/cytochrome c5